MGFLNLFLIIINFILLFYILNTIKKQKIENNIKREIHSMLAEFSRISAKYVDLIEERVSQAKHIIKKLENFIEENEKKNNYKKELKLINNFNKENKQLKSERVFTKYEKIMKLYKEGKNLQQITEETGYTLGEIKTIISLYKNYPGSINK